MDRIVNLIRAVRQNLADVNWWAGEIPSWIIFVILASVVFDAWSRYMTKRRDEPFAGWELLIIHGEGNVQREALYLEEVKKCKASRFELFKMVKSNLTNFGWWYSAPAGESPFSGEPAWIREEGKAFVIDLPQAKARNLIEEIKKGQRT